MQWKMLITITLKCFPQISVFMLINVIKAFHDKALKSCLRNNMSKEKKCSKSLHHIYYAVLSRSLKSLCSLLFFIF